METKEADIIGNELKIASELAAARRRNRLLLAAVAVLSAIFILGAVLVVIGYRKMAEVKRVFEAMQEGMAASESAQAGAQSVYANTPGSVFSSSGPAASSLTPFMNLDASAPARPNLPPGGEKTYKALMKYSDRPIVKEFIAELNKDPELRLALEKTGSGGPMKLLSDPRTFKSVNAIMARFAFRPDFMKLAMEAMSDPELKPLLRGMPGAGMSGLNPQPGASGPKLQPGEVPAPTDAGKSADEALADEVGIEFYPTSIASESAQHYTIHPASASSDRSSSIKRKAPPPVW